MVELVCSWLTADVADGGGFQQEAAGLSPLEGGGSGVPFPWHRGGSYAGVVRWITAALLVMFGACGIDEATERAKEQQAERKADAEADVELASCGLDNGRMVANVTVVNGSSERSNYTIKVAFTSPDGAEQLASGFSYVSGLEPGQRAEERVSSLEEPAGEFDCGVIDVMRLSDE